VKSNSHDLDWIDKLSYRLLIIPLTKKSLAERATQFAWIDRPDFPQWVAVAMTR